MHRLDLLRAVARVTGDSLTTIKRLGFNLCPHSPENEEPKNTELIPLMTSLSDVGDLSTSAKEPDTSVYDYPLSKRWSKTRANHIALNVMRVVAWPRCRTSIRSKRGNKPSMFQQHNNSKNNNNP